MDIFRISGLFQNLIPFPPLLVSVTKNYNPLWVTVLIFPNTDNKNTTTISNERLSYCWKGILIIWILSQYNVYTLSNIIRLHSINYLVSPLSSTPFPSEILFSQYSGNGFQGYFLVPDNSSTTYFKEKFYYLLVVFTYSSVIKLIFRTRMSIYC